MNRLCELCGMNVAIHHGRACLLAALLLSAATGLSARAQSSNESEAAAPAEPPSGKLDESAFRIISERNIFNANRIGPMPLNPNRRRDPVVESFTLVGTMAYEKGAFAFFNGSRSDFTRAVKADGVIAGYKVAEIYTDSVKLEADGKLTEVRIGSQMRREDEGPWRVAEAPVNVAEYSSSRGTSRESSRDSWSRDSRSDRGRGESSYRDRDERSNRSDSSNNSSSSSENEEEILKRLMERREKESQ